MPGKLESVISVGDALKSFVTWRAKWRQEDCVDCYCDYNDTDAQRFIDYTEEMMQQFENMTLKKKNNFSKQFICVPFWQLLLHQHWCAGFVWVVTLIIQENTAASTCAVTVSIKGYSHVMMSPVTRKVTSVVSIMGPSEISDAHHKISWNFFILTHRA